MTIFLSLVFVFVLILLVQESFARFKFSRIKKKIIKNPFIGKIDEHNSYSYEEGGYTVGYKIGTPPTGIKTFEWLLIKRRLTFFEEKLQNIKRSVNKFFIYQRWTVIFHPPILFLLLGSMIIFYFGFVQTQKVRVERLKWIVASVAGVSPGQVQYIGNGWLEIYGQRKTSRDRINEPVRYTFNPLRWLFFQEGGFVTRWRGKSFGYATHPVAFNDRGDVWLNKEGTWRHGRFTTDKTLEWDVPQGTRKVSGHELSTQDKKLYIQDK